MVDRPILFSGPMVAALLAGRKTQTRRVCKPQPLYLSGSSQRRVYRDEDFKKSWATIPGCMEGDGFSDCHFGEPGDRLWVRENWRASEIWDSTPPRFISGNEPIHYEADGAATTFRVGKLRPGMFLPAIFARITLEITDIRCERLQEISEDDAKAEGAEAIEVGGEDGVSMSDFSHREGYAKLWEQINGPGSWASNPWVWAITFKRVEASHV